MIKKQSEKMQKRKRRERKNRNQITKEEQKMNSFIGGDA